MSNWDSTHYLKFRDERTRPAADLAARVKLDRPNLIADLGCGPGNSTEILRLRWPESHIVGVDNSPEMIATAKKSFPQQDWVLADVAIWKPANPVDLAFSNAALQWLPDHAVLVARLFELVAPGGALAFQIPSASFALVRTLIHQLSLESPWNERMAAARGSLTLGSPSFYYDVLAEKAASLDIWETEYNHVLNSKEAVVDWIASTGLRPFLAALESEDERNAFRAELQRRVNDAYDSRVDGKVLFPFRRTFVIAYR